MVHSSSRLFARRRAVRVLLLVAGLASASTCGDSPTTPKPIPIPNLTVTCPAAVEGQSADGSPVAVTFGSPLTSGGQAPVTLACTPASGSLFPGGTTTVTCSATDARAVRATCTTSVFVRVPPKLVGTKFMAFGDSITAGRYSNPVTMGLVVSEYNYPQLLLPLLQARYKLQTITMVNEGVPSDMAHVEGIARFRSTMLQHRPEIVLLMMGTNDLLVPLGVERAIEGLTQIISEAKSPEFNARVVLATVPPQRANVPPIRPFPHLVPILNERIRALAKTQSLPLAEVHDAMTLSMIGEDNLHPTPAGMAKIAQIFFETIAANLEQPHPAVQSIR